MSHLDLLLKQISKYASRRKFIFKKNKKKITAEDLKDEIITSRLIGEMSSAEKLLKAIVDNKDWTREDIEAELHIYAKGMNDAVYEHLKVSKVIEVDDILKMYGYYE